MEGGGTYWHDLAPLSKHALGRTNVYDGAVQTTTSLLDAPHDYEQARRLGNVLQPLPRPIPSRRLCLPPDLPMAELPPHPGIPAAGAIAHDVSKVDGVPEVGEVLVSALGGAVANGAAKGRAAGVAAEVGLGQEEDVGRVGR
jgi:hypothetical protein